MLNPVFACIHQHKWGQNRNIYAGNRGQLSYEFDKIPGNPAETLERKNLIVKDDPHGSSVRKLR